MIQNWTKTHERFQPNIGKAGLFVEVNLSAEPSLCRFINMSSVCRCLDLLESKPTLVFHRRYFSRAQVLARGCQPWHPSPSHDDPLYYHPLLSKILPLKNPGHIHSAAAFSFDFFRPRLEAVEGDCKGRGRELVVGRSRNNILYHCWQAGRQAGRLWQD